MRRRQTAAIAAIVLFAVALVVALGVLVSHPLGGIAVLVGVPLAVASAWFGARRRGPARWGGVAGMFLLIAATLAIAQGQGILAEAFLAAVLLGLALLAARAAFRVHVALPPAPPPRAAVLFFNPKSGGGKAEQFGLAEEAAARGIRAVELKRDDDLRELVRTAVAEGADALAMAGGDGSQAIVAEAAAEHDLPYACIPAGTRNHFALDLGVDRDDVVGALDAFVHGGERRVDLAEVNGRVFVNNVSLGLYAEAVQREGYREAKLRTLLDTLPDVIGPEGEALDLRWRDRHGGEHSTGAVILVSNNRYRLGRPLDSGTRPRIDDGELGVTVLEPPAASSAPVLKRPWREWSARSFEVDSEGPIPAGIDGEAVVLDPPLRFTIRPLALRVRIAHAHPGASPSAHLPEQPAEVVAELVRIAGDRG
ncbi:MAG: diacylglycerol kinase family protein [Solirubrobacterales bacterium]